MAQQPVGKDLLADDAEDAFGDGAEEAGAGAGAGAGAAATGAAGDDGLDVSFADDAFEEGAPAAAAADTGDTADVADDAGDDAISAGGEDDPAGDGAADADADDLAGLDEEARTYSVKVQKRILREQRIARRAREEVATERVQRIAAQKEAFHANKSSLEVLGVTVGNEIKAKIAQLKAAKEAGESAKEVDLQQEVNELTARQRDIESAKGKFSVMPDFEGATQPNELAANWKDRNRFYGHPKFKAETLLIQDIDRRLAKSGIVGSNRTPEYFRELDKMIAAEMPDLRAKVKATFRPAVRTQQTTQRVAAVQTRGASQRPAAAGNSKRVTLTRQDVSNMITFKMDPKNPDHVRQYAREKREASNG